MTTTVRIALDSRANALALPIRAVRWEDRRAYVLSARGESIEKRWVTTGIRDDAFWEVVAGLREGDEVIVGDQPTTGERKS
jgi:macrolide-specific efflux system membrane fusion protein